MLCPTQVRVWITDSCWSSMRQAASAWIPFETGGIFLGWQWTEGSVVAGLIGPGPAAVHAKHHFVPDHSWQVRQLDAAFEQSKGDLNYLGDWHSHPYGEPIMSPTDRATLRRLSSSVPIALMGILAGGPNRWSLCSWQAQRRFLMPPRIVQQRVEQLRPPASWPTFISNDIALT